MQPHTGLWGTSASIATDMEALTGLGETGFDSRQRAHVHKPLRITKIFPVSRFACKGNLYLCTRKKNKEE